MNKIYKIVWSEIRHTYVAVSEIAKGHGRKSEKRSRLTALTLAAVMTLTGLGGLTASAAIAIGDGAALGDGAVTGSIDGAIAIGNGATIKHSNGEMAHSGSGDIAIGSNTLVNSAENGVAIGNGASVTAAGSVALGSGSVAEEDNAVNVGQLNESLNTKANIALDNVNDAGKTVVRNLAKEAVKVVNGTNTTVTESTDGNAKTYAVNVITNGTVTENNTGIVTGGTVYDAIQNYDATNGMHYVSINSSVTSVGSNIINLAAYKIPLNRSSSIIYRGNKPLFTLPEVNFIGFDWFLRHSKGTVQILFFLEQHLIIYR